MKHGGRNRVLNGEAGLPEAGQANCSSICVHGVGDLLLAGRKKLGCRFGAFAAHQLHGWGKMTTIAVKHPRHFY
jgi:hypothetical protein